MGLLAGQLSNDILPPAEQFYLGGTQFTRGYYSGQVAGDKALAATAELQLNTGVDLSRLGLSTGRLQPVLLVLRLGRGLAEPAGDADDAHRLGGRRRAAADHPLRRSGLRGPGTVEPVSPTAPAPSVSALNGGGFLLAPADAVLTAASAEARRAGNGGPMPGEPGSRRSVQWPNARGWTVRLLGVTGR